MQRAHAGLAQGQTATPSRRAVATRLHAARLIAGVSIRETPTDRHLDCRGVPARYRPAATALWRRAVQNVSCVPERQRSALKGLARCGRCDSRR